MTYVVDASVAVKWLFPEEFTEAAIRLRDEGDKVFAPDILYPEVGNAIWKRIRRGDLAAERVGDVLVVLKKAPVEVASSHLLLPRAVEIAVRTGRTMYDSLYLALARSEACPLITADRRLVNALKDGPFAGDVLWIGDIP